MTGSSIPPEALLIAVAMCVFCSVAAGVVAYLTRDEWKWWDDDKVTTQSPQQKTTTAPAANKEGGRSNNKNNKNPKPPKGENPKPPKGENPKPPKGENPKPPTPPKPPKPGAKGQQIMNTRTINGVSVDPANKGRFYSACYSPEGQVDGWSTTGAYDNKLIVDTSIALPQGRTKGGEVTSQSGILDTTDFKHPLVANALKSMKNGTWTIDQEYALMKDEKNRPKYLMVEEDGTERCVRVDDKCRSCYEGNRGLNGKNGFDLDVYIAGNDTSCDSRRRNQWVEIYKTDKC